MQEIKIKVNPLGIKVFFNGIPKLELISKEELSIIVAALENQIEKYHAKKRKKI